MSEFWNPKKWLIAGLAAAISPTSGVCKESSESDGGSRTHTPAFHKEFKHVQKWVKTFDDPERDQWQHPEKVIDQFALKPTDVVADIGAGTGYFSIRIAKTYPDVKVIAADIEQEMIDYLTEQAKARNLPNLNAEKISASKPEFSLKPNVVLIVNTYHHIDDRVNYLKALSSTTAADARIILIDFTLNSPSGPPPHHRVPPAEVVSEFKDAGFALQQEYTFLPNQYFLVFGQGKPASDKSDNPKAN